MSSEGGTSCNNIYTCPLSIFPENFNFNVLFSYDVASETLFIETMAPTSCGNEFKFGFKAGIDEFNIGNTENQMLPWSLDSVVITGADPNDECYGPEMGLYEVFDITCGDAGYFGNIYFNYVPGVDRIRFFRESLIFFTAIVEFKNPDLGIGENSLTELVLYQSPGSETLSSSNLNLQDISATIYEMSGKKVLDTTPFENGQLDISSLQKSAVYFANLVTSEGQSKTVKFIKR